MIDYIYLGPTPADEPCVQVGSKNYEELARHECGVYVRQLWRFVKTSHNEETLPESFNIVVKSNAHDFGTYYEVTARYDANDADTEKIAVWLENNAPQKWDDEARKELR